MVVVAVAAGDDVGVWVQGVFFEQLDYPHPPVITSIESR